MAARMICVMGVSGSGKSTVGEGVAEALGGVYVDADDLHPKSNVDKMHAGTPLTDEDRWPWLRLVGETVAARAQDGPVVVACSALRRVYRDLLRETAPGIVFVQLHLEESVLRQRMDARKGHYMPPSLLTSQLATLEPLEKDEAGGRIDGARAPDRVVADALATVRAVV